MNTLKIQIKPFYKNNPFHLKDDQIHILSTNKNEEEIKQLLLQMNYENYSIFIQLELENYNYGYLFIDHKEYELYYYNDFDDYEDEIEFASKNWIKMIKNKYGIDEPIDKQEINKEFLDLMIVPLVGYDANCYRLGYGGGYYDRYLKDFNAPTIGLAYSFQYIEHYQSEDFDIPLDDIITDKKI